MLDWNTATLQPGKDEFAAGPCVIVINKSIR